MPDEMVLYDAVFATEDPWMLRLWSYDRETSASTEPRWTKLSLRLNRRTVFARLDTPAGVPAMWNHLTFASSALGRVGRMAAAGNASFAARSRSRRAGSPGGARASTRWTPD